jgi:hypothetical protein
VTEDKMPRERPQPQALVEAEDDLARVRELLTAAGRGDATAGEVKESLQGYLDEHGPALRAAAGAVTEELRQRTLEELYKWRAQLNAQLAGRQGSSFPTPDAPTAKPTGPARPESAEAEDQEAPR